MNAVESTAGLFGVRCYRMQSRVFTVPGAGGASRPMFVGAWHDRTGVIHHKGMADFLLMPRIWFGRDMTNGFKPVRITVPLWVECKAGEDRLSEDQLAFRADVEDAGAFWICCHDSSESLLEWFKKMGVERE